MMLRHLPNLITLCRMAMAPPIAWLILNDRMPLAAALFVLVAGSDALDGALARRFGWQSRLGSILDPLADKLLTLCAAMALWHADRLPGWFVIVVLVRDLVIVSGAFAYQKLVAPLAAEPSALSKLCMAMNAITLVAFMLNGQLDGQLRVDDRVCQLLLIATTVLIVSSCVHYVGRYTRRAIAHSSQT